MKLSSHITYTPVAKILHWLVVVILVGQYVVAWTMPHMGRNTTPDTLINLHFSLGMTVLFVLAIRLGWRWTHPEPTPIDGLSPWQVFTARAVHYLLYMLLFVIPILGWANASFRGFDVTLFGLVTIPKLLATRSSGFAWTGDVHVLLSYYVLLPVVALHVLTALYHQFIRKDGVMTRMLPASWSDVSRAR
jgi:cytochrome b561